MKTETERSWISLQNLVERLRIFLHSLLHADVTRQLVYCEERGSGVVAGKTVAQSGEGGSLKQNNVPYT